MLTQQLIPDLAGAYGGAYRQIDVRPVPGLVSCADFPAAVSPSGQQTVMIVLNVAANAVCKMLASGGEGTRELSLGAPGSNLTSLIGGGVTADGKQFILQNTDGLFGSLAGRLGRDGIDAGGQWWIPDSEIQNIEQIEAGKPFVVLGRRLRPAGLDGSGRYRAGVGFRATFSFGGLLGGQIVWYVNESFEQWAGAVRRQPRVGRARVGEARHRHARLIGQRMTIGGIDDVHGEEEILPYKGTFFMADNDVIEWTSPAAAGYGDPLMRDPELVLADMVRWPRRRGDSQARVRRRDPRREAPTARRPRANVGRTARSRAASRERTSTLRTVLSRSATSCTWSTATGGAMAPTSVRRAKATGRTQSFATGRCREIGPEFDVLDVESADRFVLREYLCPVTGYRIDAEIALHGSGLLEDVLISGGLTVSPGSGPRSDRVGAASLSGPQSLNGCCGEYVVAFF